MKETLTIEDYQKAREALRKANVEGDIWMYPDGTWSIGPRMPLESPRKPAGEFK